MHYYILFSLFFFLRLLMLNKIKLSRCCAVLMYDILIYVLKAWTQKQDRRWPLRCRRSTLVGVARWYLLSNGTAGIVVKNLKITTKQWRKVQETIREIADVRSEIHKWDASRKIINWIYKKQYVIRNRRTKENNQMIKLYL